MSSESGSLQLVESAFNSPTIIDSPPHTDPPLILRNLDDHNIIASNPSPPPASNQHPPSLKKLRGKFSFAKLKSFLAPVENVSSKRHSATSQVSSPTSARFLLPPTPSLRSSISDGFLGNRFSAKRETKSPSPSPAPSHDGTLLSPKTYSASSRSPNLRRRRSAIDINVLPPDPSLDPFAMSSPLSRSPDSHFSTDPVRSTPHSDSLFSADPVRSTPRSDLASSSSLLQASPVSLSLFPDPPRFFSLPSPPSTPPAFFGSRPVTIPIPIKRSPSPTCPPRPPRRDWTLDYGIDSPSLLRRSSQNDEFTATAVNTKQLTQERTKKYVDVKYTHRRKGSPYPLLSFVNPGAPSPPRQTTLLQMPLTPLSPVIINLPPEESESSSPVTSSHTRSAPSGAFEVLSSASASSSERAHPYSYNTHSPISDPQTFVLDRESGLPTTRRTRSEDNLFTRSHSRNRHSYMRKGSTSRSVEQDSSWWIDDEEEQQQRLLEPMEDFAPGRFSKFIRSFSSDADKKEEGTRVEAWQPSTPGYGHESETEQQCFQNALDLRLRLMDFHSEGTTFGVSQQEMGENEEEECVTRDDEEEEKYYTPRSSFSH